MGKVHVIFDDPSYIVLIKKFFFFFNKHKITRKISDLCNHDNQIKQPSAISDFCNHDNQIKQSSAILQKGTC